MKMNAAAFGAQLAVALDPAPPFSQRQARHGIELAAAALAERALLERKGMNVSQLQACLDPIGLQDWQRRCQQQHCSDNLIAYVLDLAAASRRDAHGLSPRASQGLVAAAQAWSLLQGRDHVRIDDVQSVFPAVAEHRLDAGVPSSAEYPLSEVLLRSVDALR